MTIRTMGNRARVVDRTERGNRTFWIFRPLVANQAHCARLLVVVVGAAVMLGSSNLAVAAGSSGHAGTGARQGSAHASAATQGYLGIDIRDVSADRVAALKLKAATGAEIIHVDHDGPAGKAGLRVQDVVLSMNGQTITSEAQLRKLLRETPPGGNVTLVLSRDGEQQTIHTQLADRTQVERQAWLQHMVPAPDGTNSSEQTAGSAAASPGTAPRSPHGNGFLSGGTPAAPAITAPPDPQSHSLIGSLMLGSSYTGAVLEVIGPQLAQFFGSTNAGGLLVRSVVPNSPAAIAGLRAGDVVLRANSVVVASTGAWSRLVRENRGKELAVVVLREHQEQTLRLIPDGKRRSSLERAPLGSLPVTPVPQDAWVKTDREACARTGADVDCTNGMAHFA